ncbi:GumB protein [Tsuneonella deserti]|uniref:GumB protein n=1 Tax=Tsuneonella deserti TaxID=2035528 RepID=A0ABQ1SDQ9_9SPHN|nr:polysaccharide biosynthesis/export family protein [Tsuneonella deserti]GGE03269.1 GumB protein [Tsuneonella deserti]
MSLKDATLRFANALRLIAPIVALIPSAGCVSAPRTYAESPSIELATNNALPPPERADVLAQERPYLIGPYDKLTVDVYGIEGLAQRRVQIDAGGQISFPLIGSVQAGGLTPSELAASIEEKLRGRYIRDPQVTVNLESTTSRVVTVDGEVDRPGLYPVMGHMTLLRAVATAGGTGEYARLQDVVVQRSVNGQKYLALYNLEGIRRGNYDDPELFPNDIVVVGDSPGRRLFRDIISASGLITAPVVAILR